VNRRNASKLTATEAAIDNDPVLGVTLSPTGFSGGPRTWCQGAVAEIASLAITLEERHCQEPADPAAPAQGQGPRRSNPTIANQNETEAFHSYVLKRDGPSENDATECMTSLTNARRLCTAMQPLDVRLSRTLRFCAALLDLLILRGWACSAG
jgi:hypothetical protein